MTTDGLGVSLTHSQPSTVVVGAVAGCRLMDVDERVARAPLRMAAQGAFLPGKAAYQIRQAGPRASARYPPVVTLVARFVARGPAPRAAPLHQNSIISLRDSRQF